MTNKELALTDFPMSDRVRLLARTSLFGSLPEESLVALAAHAQERRVLRGDTLFQRGDPGDTMLVILAGEVRLALPGAAGRDQILRILKAGDVFGEIAMLDGGPRTADAGALTNCRLLVLERRYVLSQVEKDSTLALSLIKFVCNRLRTADTQIDAMAFDDLGRRLAASLLNLTQAHGHQRVDLTQSVLGEMIGASREAVNRKLREWEQAGLVALSPGRIIVHDAQRLAALLPEASARDM
jgi:CRP/FNR family transcriptional regulator, cyclic AMP receptor protein